MTAETDKQFVEQMSRAYGGEIPRAYWNRLLALALRGAETQGYDDDTATKILGWLAEITGAKDWVGCDGSEEWDGDVRGTIYNILKSAGVYDDETGTVARHPLTALGEPTPQPMEKGS